MRRRRQKSRAAKRRSLWRFYQNPEPETAHDILRHPGSQISWDVAKTSQAKIRRTWSGELGVASLSPVSYFSWSLEPDIPKLAPIPTLEWTISFFLEWSRFFKWTSCPSENHLFGIIRKRKRWNHFHKREYDWSHLITLVHILKSKSYIVLRNVQYYAIDLPVDLYSGTCQSHCRFIYKIKLKRTPSCSKKRIDSSMKRR